MKNKNIIVNNNEYEIVVIGLGYVGLTYALYINTLGFNVLAIEKNKETINKVNSGSLPFFEEGLEMVMNNSINQKLIKAYTPSNFRKIKSDLPKLYIISVGTPISSNNLLNTDPLDSVFDNLKSVINTNDGIIFRSTVKIGFSRKYCESLNKKIFYCFAPERTIEGKAIKELSTLPQVYGANYSSDKIFFKDFFMQVSNEIVQLSKTESAELVKLTSNVYRDVIFGFSNEISLISYKNQINPKEVINACNYKYPRCDIKSSGPVAGPCLSKDSYILGDSFKNIKSNSVIMNARKLNEKYVLEILKDLIKNVKSASILGISFKGTPPTNDIRDSYAIKIINFLNSKKIKVSGYDPMVYQEDFEKLNLIRDNTLEQAFSNKDLIIIQNNNEIFKRMDLIKLSNLSNTNSIIVDLWTLHQNITLTNSKYIGL